MSIRRSLAQQCGTCNKWQAVGANKGHCTYMPPPVLDKLFEALNGKNLRAKIEYETQSTFTEREFYCSEWEPND